MFREEFQSEENITDLLPSLDIIGYSNYNDSFSNLNNYNSVESKIDFININNVYFKIIYNNELPIHINNNTHEIYVADEHTCIKFLKYCFDLKESQSNPLINKYIKDVIARI